MDPRKAMFAICKSLGMDDDARHDMMQAITGKNSSKNLTPNDWRILLDHLHRVSGNQQAPNEWAWVDSAAPDRQPQLRKIIMLAKAAGLKRGNQIAYVEGIAKQAAGLGGGNTAKPLRMCDAQELRILVQALSVHNRRHGKAAKEPT